MVYEKNVTSIVVAYYDTCETQTTFTLDSWLTEWNVWENDKHIIDIIFTELNSDGQKETYQSQLDLVNDVELLTKLPCSFTELDMLPKIKLVDRVI